MFQISTNTILELSQFKIGFKKSISSSKGFSLLEVTIAFGLVGVIMMALMSMTDIMNANNRRLMMIFARNEIVNNIRAQSLVYTNMDASASMTNALGVPGMIPDIPPTNALNHFDALIKCLPVPPGGAALSGCDKTSMDDPVRGDLFYLANNKSTDVNNALAGEDVYYRVSGIRCDTTDSVTPEKCPLFARVWFEPFCLNFSTTCNKAMALTIRYSVGVRSDLATDTTIPTADGEVYLPLQKGIQISRVLSHTNAGLNSNPAGIYPVQKFLDFPDQAAYPRGLRFEVIIGNPTGLFSMKVQMRALTGVSAYGLDETTVPAGLEALSWTDVVNPGTGFGPWTITLAGAQPSQIFNFGTMTTASTSSGLVNVSFAIGSTLGAGNASTYHWTKNSGTPSIFNPPAFKSGFYQFRILATDVGGGTVESTNYATVRILPRPEIVMTEPISNPFNVDRNCTSANTLATKFLIGDDEGLVSNTSTLNTVPVPTVSIPGTSGEITIPFDLQGAAGNYVLSTSVTNFFSNKTVMGIPLFPSLYNLGLVLKEVPPVLSTITSNPPIIRINTNATLALSYTTGSCCSQVPTAAWNYLNVPASPGIMLSGPTTSAVTCTTNDPTNTRVCSTTASVLGIKEGPAGATPDVSSTLAFSPPINPACSNPTSTYTQSAYVQVVTIPGISFYTPDSLWLDFSDLQNEMGLLRPLNPKAWIKADFQPDVTVSVQVEKSTMPGVPVCVVSFPGGTGSIPVFDSCNLDPTYSGDYVLTKNTANVQGIADLPNASFRAKIVAANSSHRACNAKISSLLGHSATLTVPTNVPMWNSPFNANDIPAGSGDTTLGQDPYNDTGHWSAGAVKNLRCYDHWPTWNDFYNDQDAKVIKAYRDSLTFWNAFHINFTTNYSSYVFPNNSAPDFSSVDFNSLNAPVLFMVSTGAPSSGIIWQYTTGAGAASSTAPKVWNNRTGEACSGASSLPVTKLYSTPMLGFSSGTTTMKATNRFTSSVAPNTYSYMFFCTYGRWNPVNTTPSWID